MSSLPMVLAGLAALLAAVAVVEPRVGRVAWTSATLAVAGWLTASVSIGSGAVIAAGILAAALVEGEEPAPPRHFLGLIRRIAIVGLGMVGAVLFTGRALEPQLGATAQVIAFTAASASALLLTLAGSARERERTARFLLVLAATPGLATTHVQPVAASALVALALLAIALFSRAQQAARPPRSAGTPLLAGGLVLYACATALVLARQPLALLTLGAIGAQVLPRLGSQEENRGWRAALLLGSLVAFAGLTAAALPHLVNARLSALAIALGFLALVGSYPFGLGLRQWLMQAPRPLFVLVCAGVSTALLATLITSQAATSPPRAGSTGAVIALFGALTVLLAGLRSLGAGSWRALAADGVIADIGLALVGIGASDARGATAAALVITSMVLTRPLMLLLDQPGSSTGAIRRLAEWVAAASGAGLPPTFGFAARLLVLGAAIRVNALVAGIVVAGLAVLIPASFTRVLARPAPRHLVAELS